MSDVLVTNQGLPPAQEAHMEFTTVIILRMWLFTATLLDQTLALVYVYQVQFHLASLFVSCLHSDSLVPRSLIANTSCAFFTRVKCTIHVLRVC